MSRLLTDFRPRLGLIETRRIKPGPKRAAPFYVSLEWRELMRQIILERGGRCEDPAHDPAQPGDAWLFGDHIRELSDGGAPLDRSNIMLRCAACHGRKTAAERKRRATATYG